MNHFATPWILLAAVVVPALAILLHRWSESVSKRKLDGVIAPRLREQLLRSVDFTQRWRKAFLLAGGFACLLVAIARPLFGNQPMEVERSSVDFIIGVDLSLSMLAEDAEGKSRLAATKAGVSKLLDKVGSDRVGLVAFAGEAFLAAPITQDHEAVRRNLQGLKPTMITKQGSDLAKAIEFASKTFENGNYETKALVLVTDGEELQGNALNAARAAAGKGMAVFTVGVGTSMGARIPEPAEIRPTAAAAAPSGPKFVKNEFGREVTSRLNETMLQQLASSGRGFYEPLGKDGAGLISTWRRGLEPLSKGTQTKQSKDMREYFQWPLFLAFAFFLTEMLVSDRRKPLIKARA
jgi:Ca-activated chloride channel family protein